MVAMAKAKKTSRLNEKSLQTPLAYLITGLAMWLVAYVLLLLATDSGSNLEWLGFFVGFVWGMVRIIQGLQRYLKKL
jgi:hypothetical protein